MRELIYYRSSTEQMRKSNAKSSYCSCRFTCHFDLKCKRRWSNSAAAVYFSYLALYAIEWKIGLTGVSVAFALKLRTWPAPPDAYCLLSAFSRQYLIWGNRVLHRHDRRRSSRTEKRAERAQLCACPDVARKRRSLLTLFLRAVFEIPAKLLIGTSKISEEARVGRERRISISPT